MNTRERALVYGALIALAVLNVVVLLGGPSRAAVASPAPDSDAPPLGPASKLTLAAQDDDGSDLVVGNHKGRIGWGDSGYERVQSMAFVHIGPLMTQLMSAEDLLEEREALIEELQGADEEYRERLAEIRARIEAMDPESPEAQEARAIGQQVLQEAQQWGAQAQARQAELQTSQMVLAYEELVSAVNIVAERLDIDVVFRYIPADEPFEDVGPDGALVSIRLRTALRCPEEIDITPEVTEELALESE